MADDIVTSLRAEADAHADGDWNDQVIRRRFTEAADEIERLRTQVKFAHNIIGSEAMVWVFHGSEGWLQANLQYLRDPIHLYWETYGNAFKEARRER